MPPAGLAAAPDARSGRIPGGTRRIVLFFALIAVLGSALDALIDHALRRVDTGDLGVWNRIVQGRINADVLITGSSRAYTHYDPRILRDALGGKVYNIGLNGSQTDMQLARLKTYLRHNRKPALLIHNLDAFAFQVTHGGVYDPGQYVPYLNEPDLYDALHRIDPNVWKARLLPLYGYAAQDLRFAWLAGLRDALRPPPVDPLVDGYKARHTRWTGEFEQFRAANPDGFQITVEPEGLRVFEQMLQLCAERGVRVVLAYSPEYLPVQQMTRNRAEIMTRFEALARRHGAQLLDFSASPISANQNYFYNSQHLNAEGAEAFTRELAQRLATAR